ncbi:MAG: tRNA (guanine(10)-N(2))-dimethyltransferase [Candidatus Bathyarchaeia archaeon]
MSYKKLEINFPTEVVQEGEVKALVPRLSAFIKEPSDYAPSKAPVFYNPIMELNRDLAVIAVQTYQKILSRKISICEPLTGCGIRGIRLAKEVGGVEKVVINDINEKAYQLTKYNVKMNRLCRKVTVKNEDANLLLARYAAPRKRFDVIDIDPFGSPVLFLDSAIRALRDGGLLALTATDMAPLCGVHPKACIRKYGGKPLRTEYCHELAVRLLLGCLATTAAKHEMGIKVLFSHSTDHYIRVYTVLTYGAKNADKSLQNMGFILHCFNCFHRSAVKIPFIGVGLRCPECGSKMDFSGPLWLKEIFDIDFCERMLAECKNKKTRNADRIRKILTLVKDEADAPITYYVVDRLCDKLGLPTISTRKVYEALRKGNFKVSFTHFNPRGLRADATAASITRILREICEMR